MPSPTAPATLTADQVDDLNRQLSTMRHDVNNYLSLIMAATELIRRKPETLERISHTLVEQPAKISDAIIKFSASFESTFGIKKG